MRKSAEMMDRREDPVAMGRVFCPKPRRVGPPSNADTPSSFLPSRFHISNDGESKPGCDLLGLLLRKEDCKAEPCPTLSSSPPFFFGSPPCRTQNPLVHDAHFGNEKLTSISKSPKDSVSPPSPHAREQQSGKKKAAVRIEGFECQNSRAVAMA